MCVFFSELDRLREEAARRHQQDQETAEEVHPQREEKEKAKEEDITTVRSLLNSRCPNVTVKDKVFESVRTFVILDCSSGTSSLVQSLFLLFLTLTG